MRIVIFTTQNHQQANFIIKNILEQNQKYFLAFAESTSLLYGKSNGEAFYKYCRIAGFNYVFPQIIKRIKFSLATKLFSLFRIGDSTSEYYLYKRLNIKIPIIKIMDVNNSEVIKKIKKYKPDLFISIFFNQIFNKEVLKIPRLGVLNLHPAYLPRYRGISPTFWVLANNEIETGVTLHTIDDELIDAGRIISQKRIKIFPDDTETSLYRRCAVEGVEMIQEAINNLVKNRKFLKLSKKMKIENGSYFSVPNKKAVAKFIKLGKKF